MVKSKDRPIKCSSVYYLPNIPYTEEFIVELFKAQDKSSQQRHRKSAQRRIYILYKNSSIGLAHATKNCDQTAECKIKPYKEGSLGLCISNIGINNDIILLTSDDHYD
jgi:hypothetical protein